MTRTVVIETIQNVATKDDSGDTEIVVVQEQPRAVVVVQPQTEIVEVVAQGPQGPPGPGGTDTSLVGYPVHLVDGQPGDLLNFTGAAWTNRPSTDVTDGGNF